ncbi:MAG: hypothetical protein M0P19_08455 [Nevskia sp.]|jgi:hypothetical protein|nr:hypothetical protein [Nevskia sp.]MCK9383737.1 hypothetical protein [Nevskia sp.]
MTNPRAFIRHSPACARCRRQRRIVLSLLALLIAFVVPAPAQTEAPPPAAVTAKPTPTPSPSAPLIAPAAVASPSEQCAAATGGAGAACCCGTQPPLQQIDEAAYRLPAGSTAKPYSHALQGRGGEPPYHFSLALGRLQNGLRLNVDGTITGQPTEAGTRGFEVQMIDSGGHSVTQLYTLPVYRPKAKSAETPSAATPAPPPKPQPLTALSLEDARAPAALKPTTVAEVYRLQPAVLDALKPSAAPVAISDYLLDETTVDNGGTVSPPAAAPAPPPAPEPAASSAAATIPPPPDVYDDNQAKQLKAMLQPLLGVEYPNQLMFSAALDAQLCAYVRQLALAAATKNKQTPPTDEQLSQNCPPNWATAKVVPDPSVTGRAVALRDLPTTLLPRPLREWLIAQALQTHVLEAWQPVLWTGGGCGCVLRDLSGEIYGFYPLWWAGPKPRQIDFSLLNRISYFALPFDDDGNLPYPDLGAPGVSDFIRVAQQHRTQIDLTVYRNNWDFLRNRSEASLAYTIEQLSKQAVELIDLPLPDQASRAKAWLPFLGETPRVGDGITLYFENLPSASGDPALHSTVQTFLRKFLLALITEMRKSNRPRALNIVIQDQQLLESNRFWTVESLYDTLRHAEDPWIIDGRIDGDSVQYKSNTNITVRYLVLLSEPSSENKKVLRRFLEASPQLHGGDRRIFLRKVIPILATGASDLKQFSDDMAYFADNFGGTGFWPTPIADETGPAAHLDLVKTNFHPSESSRSLSTEKLCGWTCPRRWPLRVIMELLILAGIISISLYGVSCRIRQLGKTYKACLLLGSAPTLMLGALLVQCDPQLQAVRQGNTLLWGLVAVLLLVAASILLKPRVVKP